MTVVERVVEALVEELVRQGHRYDAVQGRSGDHIELHGSFRLESLAAAMLHAASTDLAPPQSDGVRLLTPPHDYALVQLPHRRSAGVVMQRDCLAELIETLTIAVAERKPFDCRESVGHVIEEMEALLVSCDSAAAG